MFIAFIATVIVVFCVLVQANATEEEACRFDIKEIATNLNESLALSNGSLPIVTYSIRNLGHYANNLNAFKGLLPAAAAHAPNQSADFCFSYTDTKITGDYLTFKKGSEDSLVASAYGERWPRSVQAQVRALKRSSKDTTISEDFSKIYNNGTESFEVGHVIMKGFYNKTSTNWHILILTSALKGHVNEASCSYDNSFRALLLGASRSVQDYLISKAAENTDLVRAYMDFAPQQGHYAALKNIPTSPGLGPATSWSLGALTFEQKGLLDEYGIEASLVGDEYMVKRNFLK